MASDKEIAKAVKSFKVFADKIVDYQVEAMQQEFPKERFPVRPPYRKAMYHRLMLIIDELSYHTCFLLKELPKGSQLETILMDLQLNYEQEFLAKVTKTIV